MKGYQESHKELLPHLFRQEYSKMTAVLCRHFGLNNIEIAEDIASETFLKASENWALNGIPENPTAWLYTVVKNKTKDYFKRQMVFQTKVKACRRVITTMNYWAIYMPKQILTKQSIIMKKPLG
ncbi:MAG: hypothetical protein K2Q21_15230 [Chitinophagaceae bacterium]|nr:hypothetical protein [Chitinophagaceae bacterium]